MCPSSTLDPRAPVGIPEYMGGITRVSCTPRQAGWCYWYGFSRDPGVSGRTRRAANGTDRLWHMHITALAGGVGGARFIRGLRHHLDTTPGLADSTVTAVPYH